MTNVILSSETYRFNPAKHSVIYIADLQLDIQNQEGIIHLMILQVTASYLALAAAVGCIASRV
jgi:hypothetical protein